MTHKTRRAGHWIVGFTGFFLALFNIAPSLNASPLALAGVVFGVLMIASAAEGLTRIEWP